MGGAVALNGAAEFAQQANGIKSIGQGDLDVREHGVTKSSGDIFHMNARHLVACSRGHLGRYGDIN